MALVSTANFRIEFLDGSVVMVNFCGQTVTILGEGPRGIHCSTTGQFIAQFDNLDYMLTL